MFAVLIALCAASGALEAAGAPPRPSLTAESPELARLREAKALRYAQRYYEAAHAYRRFLADFPNSARTPEARFWLAASLEQDQRWDEAAAAYTDFLEEHPDQRLLGKEARLNRLRCWGIRQGQSPSATPGLLAALQDDLPEAQVVAALQLAKVGDRRGVSALQRGLTMPAYADAATLALNALNVKPAPPSDSPQGRFLVLRIQEAGKKDPITIRLALGLARVVENYLSSEQIRLARSRGVPLENLTQRALDAPKGTLLLSVDDGKSHVAVTVE